MVLHPDVYKKAHEEIDRVIGQERLVDFDDRENLPYMECVMMEVLRCAHVLEIPRRYLLTCLSSDGTHQCR